MISVMSDDTVMPILDGRVVSSGISGNFRGIFPEFFRKNNGIFPE